VNYLNLMIRFVCENYKNELPQSRWDDDDEDDDCEVYCS